MSYMWQAWAESRTVISEGISTIEEVHPKSQILAMR